MTSLITAPHPLLLLSLKLPSQKPFTAFRVVELSRLSMTIFLSLCANVGPMEGFLIVFSVDMLRKVVDVRDRLGDSPLPP